MMKILISLVVFLLYGVLQALIINGIKAASDGSVEELPTGKLKYKGMILFPVANWITRTATKVYSYNVITVQLLVDMLANKYPSISQPVSMVNMDILNPEADYSGACAYIALAEGEDTKMLMQYLSFVYEKEGISFCLLPGKGYGFFKKVQEPVLPSIIRKPLIECIKCMASFWGAVTFWPVAIWLMDFHLWMIPVYVADVFLLVYLNYYYFKTLIR